MRELGFIDEMKNEIWKMKLYWSMILFSPGKLLASTMRSLKNQYDGSFTPALSQGQANAPFAKRTMVLKNVQLFWLKLWKTEARYWIKGSYVMQVCQRSQKNNAKSCSKKMSCKAWNDMCIYVQVSALFWCKSDKKSGKMLQTYALLDSCSQWSYILHQLTKYLGTSGGQTSITIKTISGEFKV